LTQSPSWPPVIAAERLRLRPTTLDDAAPMARLVNDIDIARMTTSIPHPFRMADAEGFITRMAAADRAREALFGVELTGEGLIGVVGLHPNDQARVEIGYWLGRSYWGCGYMTEAVERVLVWAREEWGRGILASGHFADNPASAAVLIKAGFLYTGERRARYSLAREAEAETRMMIWLA
jgi:RimJ/RimL family protein N-acetyltransferase